MSNTYEQIKQLAKENGMRVNDLIALSPANDPFYTGRPAEVEAARWFAGLWRQFGYGRGVHLRRIHYQIVSQDPPMNKPNGEPYLNTDKDWSWLSNAGKYARYLNLVNAHAFVDRRNKDPLEENVRWHDTGGWAYEPPTPGCHIKTESWAWADLPDVPSLPDLEPLPGLPNVRATGYESIEQDYLVEVWSEKTTMDDVLIPLCQRWGVNLVRGAGELSITLVVEFLERVRRANRPARILYISDFDPAGLGMPISVARKIEFYQRTFDYGDLDIRLQPICLTAEQVEDYRLPRTPVKKTDARRAAWELNYGPGQVELDALEALHPGELGSITEEAVEQYIDLALVDKALEEKAALQEALDEWREDALEREDVRGLIDPIQAEHKALMQEWTQLQDEYERLTEPIYDRMAEVDARMGELLDDGRRAWSAVASIMRQDNPVDPEESHPLPEPDLPYEDDDQLYVSGLDYAEQLIRYKSYRNTGEVEG